MPTPETLRFLLDRVIDYAGLFPPAELSFERATRNYSRYRESPEAWMLGRFITPAARADVLLRHLERMTGNGGAVELSVVAGGGESVDAFLEKLRDDLTALQSAAESFDKRARVKSFEIRLPATAEDETLSADDTNEAVVTAAEMIDEADFAQTPIFFETSLAGDWERALNRGVDAVHAYCQQPLAQGGFKLRCGGVEAAAFPAAELVAATIGKCCEAGIALKFTAGMHQPLYHHDDKLQVHMHGFLNVFLAGVVASARRPELATLRELLEETDPQAFTFTDTKCGWRGQDVTQTEIQFARRQRVVSFGSCSFEEPREGLKDLGVLD